MDELKKIEEKLLENAAGGSTLDNMKLVFVLCAKGYGDFYDENRHDTAQIDLSRMQEYFTQKGYKLICGDGEAPNVIIGPDGKKYDTDTIFFRKLSGNPR